jgi:hypothetical protein
MDIKNWAASIGFYDKPEVKKRRVMTMGPAGGGKTTFAATFPKPFFIDTDRGGQSLEDLHIPFISLERGERGQFEVILDILRKLRDKAAPFDKIEVETLVIDSFTALAESLMVATMLYPAGGMGLTPKDPNKGKPEWDHYAAVGNMLKTIVGMTKDLPLNVVLICGEKLEKDDVTGGYVGEPNVVGGYRHVITHDVDYVFYQRVEGRGDKRTYMLHTIPVGYFNMKMRQAKTAPLAPKYENPSFNSIWGGATTKEPTNG